MKSPALQNLQYFQISCEFPSKMSCCGGPGCEGSLGSNGQNPPSATCCAKQDSLSIRLPSCAACTTSYSRAPEPTKCQRPCLCVQAGPCSAFEGGAGAGQGQQGECSQTSTSQQSSCRTRVFQSKKCPKNKCCPKSRNRLGDCPDQVTWPDPPKIDMCCSEGCPPRILDICYMKVIPGGSVRRLYLGKWAGSIQRAKLPCSNGSKKIAKLNINIQINLIIYFGTWTQLSCTKNWHFWPNKNYVDLDIWIELI